MKIQVRSSRTYTTQRNRTRCLAAAVSIARLAESRYRRMHPTDAPHAIDHMLEQVSNSSQQCQETRPACTNCKNKDIICIYPSKAEQRLERRHQLLPEQRQRFSLNGAGGYDYDYNCAPKEAMQRTLTPTLFTASDLRFFISCSLRIRISHLGATWPG